MPYRNSLESALAENNVLRERLAETEKKAEGLKNPDRPTRRAIWEGYNQLLKEEAKTEKTSGPKCISCNAKRTCNHPKAKKYRGESETKKRSSILPITILVLFLPFLLMIGRFVFFS